MHENYLNLSHRKLTSIPNIPPSIIKLDLRRNQIDMMDLPYSDLLEEVDLSDNKIKNIKALENIPNIKVLDLSYNLISEMEFPKMDLQELYLICNDILFIENLNMPNLKIIDLAVNEIDEIENLGNCINLEELYLGSNKITKVPDLTFLNKLRVLDLQNNNLKEVDCSKLPKTLDQLLLSENENLISVINLDQLGKLSLLAIKKTQVKIENDKIEIWK